MKGSELLSSLGRVASTRICALRPRPALQNRFIQRPTHSRCAAQFSTSTHHSADLESNNSNIPPSLDGPITAAAPINFKDIDRGGDDFARNFRVVPASPSYFGGMPNYTDSFIYLESILRKYQTLPVLPPGQAPRVAWKTIEQLRVELGEPIKAGRYARIMAIVKRLNYIHTDLLPGEVTEALKRFKRDFNPFDVKVKPSVIDEWGRSKGVGRRKTSSAVAWLVEGEGEVLINGKTLTQMFGRLHHRESAIWALKATQRVDKYNIFALVKGGGHTGQAEALTLAIAKALLVHEPLLKPVLRRAGCVTRDPRIVERKKPGHLKARKMPAWVAR